MTSSWSIFIQHLFIFDNFTRNSNEVKIVTVVAFPVLMRCEIIIILYSRQRHVLVPAGCRLTAGTLAATIDFNRKIGNVTGFPHLSCEIYMNLQDMFHLEADSCSAVIEIPVFYGLVIVMGHKTYPLERNTNQLH